MAYGHAERNLAALRQLEVETRQLLESLDRLDPEQSAWLQGSPAEEMTDETVVAGQAGCVLAEPRGDGDVRLRRKREPRRSCAPAQPVAHVHAALLLRSGVPRPSECEPSRVCAPMVVTDPRLSADAYLPLMNSPVPKLRRPAPAFSPA
jgi:hypothetical protein